MRAADYTPEEADRLRRSMAAWGRGGDMQTRRAHIRERMAKNGYEAGFIEQILEQIKGFGSYGFPQSHAASFAKLVYISAWLKRHEPAAFACALLNAQPMGFYSPSQIVQDIGRAQAGRAGVKVRAVDVCHSHWDCSLEDDGGVLALRLGLRQISGLSETAGQTIVAARKARGFVDLHDLCRRADLDAKARQALADAGALQSLAGHRHAARWEMAGIERQLPLLPGSPEEIPVALPCPHWRGGAGRLSSAWLESERASAGAAAQTPATRAGAGFAPVADAATWLRGALRRHRHPTPTAQHCQRHHICDN